MRTPGALKSLQDWRESQIDNINPALLILPQADRDFRRSVIEQHKTASQARQWYSEEAPDILERHQQLSEDLQSLVHRALCSYSRLASDTSMSCSVSLNNLASFSSLQFISSRYEEVEAEEKHMLLQICEYHDHLADESISQPVFGLGPEVTAPLVREMLAKGNDQLVPWKRKDWMEWDSLIKAMEEACLAMDPLHFFNDQHDLGRHTIIMYALWCDEPLLPITRADISTYRNGIPRGDIGPLFERIPQSIRKDVIAIMVAIIDLARQIAPLDGEVQWGPVSQCLAREQDAGRIIKDIWRKWDVVNHRPLPEGVERVLTRLGFEVMWKKTKSRYYPEDDSSTSQNSTPLTPVSPIRGR